MNDRIVGMYCIQCGKEVPVGDYPEGCPACFKRGHPANLTLRYSGSFGVNDKERRMMKYTKNLPYDDFVNLGEGGTPSVLLPRLAEKLGIAKLTVKNEFQNPTGSHKDRMNPFIIARAKAMGYKRIAAASSGNEGISLACYAAAAGMPCTIVGDVAMGSMWKKAMAIAGAEVVIVETKAERLRFIREKMAQDGWFGATNVYDPPIGSSPFGIQGYKTIAYEIAEEMTKLPDYIMVPVARGDLLWGIYEGFCELKAAAHITEIPRLIAVEPFKRIEKVKASADCAKYYEGESKKTPSIGGNSVTVQAFLALQKSGGFAVSVPQCQVEEAIHEMGKSGMYLESSSALPIIALKRLVKTGEILSGSEVMIIATSHGFKNALAE